MEIYIYIYIYIYILVHWLGLTVLVAYMWIRLGMLTSPHPHVVKEPQEIQSFKPPCKYAHGFDFESKTQCDRLIVRTTLCIKPIVCEYGSVH